MNESRQEANDREAAILELIQTGVRQDKVTPLSDLQIAGRLYGRWLVKPSEVAALRKKLAEQQAPEQPQEQPQEPAPQSPTESPT